MQSSNNLRLLQATAILVVFASLLLYLGPVSVQAINSGTGATAGSNTASARLTAPSVTCSGTPVVIGNDKVYFSGVRYDYPRAGQSTWYYCIESGRRPAISHVTYDLDLTGEGGCQTVADSGTWGPTQDNLQSGAGIPVTGQDPRTNIYGLKFDQGFNDNEVRNYYFTINGNFVEEEITVATKGGTGFDIGFVTAPSTSCQEVASPEPPPAPDLELAKMCYAISDGYFDQSGTQHQDSNAKDTLAYLNRLTGQTASVDGVIPNIATDDIEAMTFKPGADVLYAADADILGTVNLTNGDFTAVGGVFGIAEGYVASSASLRNETINDVDSLTFDVVTGILWGVERSSSRPDMLFQINPATGQYIPDVFDNPSGAAGKVDYLQVKPQDGLEDIDDIASHPITGELYAIMNQGGGASKLVKINTSNGDTTAMGWYTRIDSGEVIYDLEGLSFFNDGRLYGSTGKDFHQLNVLWQIDTETAVATAIGEFTNRLIDIEALGCLTAPGFVAIQKSTNGMDANTAPGPNIEVGDPVTWDYLVRNTGGRTLYNIQVTDDQEGVICDIPQLGVGESNVDVGVTCQATGTATSGQYANVATVTGNDSPDGESGTEYTHSDPSHYYGYVPAAVGDYVWRDTDADGIQDSFEVGVAGVVVKLYNATNNTLLSSTTTNVNGYYLFDTLSPDSYYLEFVLPAGYTGFSPKDIGTDNALDSDVDPNNRKTAPFTLIANQSDLTWDAGLLGQGQPASIGDFVWEDLNANGIQDEGEPGIQGVAVKLYNIDGSEKASTTTAADGSYNFTVEAGDYFIVFNTPAGYLLTTANAGDDNSDSDADAIFNGESNRYRSSFTQLSAGENEPNWDAGYYRVGSIGDTIWLDADANGAQNGGEAGIEGVTVILSDSEGNVVATTVTDANGKYLFENVLAGDYTVTVDPSTLPNDLGQTHDLNGPLDHSASVTLSAGGSNLDVDFGYASHDQLVASIGNHVWNDLNSDGIQDDGEPGIGGVAVTLYDADDNEIGSTTTLADGSYIFTDLPPGDYYLIFTRPDGYEASPIDANGNTQDEQDSDADTVTGRTITTTLEASENDITWDAGFYEAGSIAEPDINLQKTVYVGHDGGASCPGGELASGVTDSNVTYCFVVTNTGGEPLNNITINDSTLGITQTHMTVLSGTTPLAPGETLVYYYNTSITTELINTATVTAGGTITDSDSAEVDQVAPAIELQKTVYTGHSEGSACPGGELVSDYNGTAVTYCFLVTNTGDTYLGAITIDDPDLGITLTKDVLLAPGESSIIYHDGTINGNLVNTAAASGNPTDEEGIDLPGVENPTDDDTAEVEGLVCITSIGDTIFLDSDGDGVQGINEPGISGIVINLIGAGTDGVLGTADDVSSGTQSTDSNGHYSFTALQAGTYRVDVDENTLPEGYQLTTGNEPMIVQVSACEAKENADFGYAASVCETALMYGVFDADNRDTQFFTLDLGTGVASALGPQYDEYDVEAIELHPETGVLYAIAGGGGNQDGKLFTVDKETGGLTLIGNTGIGVDANEIVSAAFDPQDNLWVYQENVGLFTININTAVATQQWSAQFGDNWEGLAWEPEGNYLYASQGRDLFRWDPSTSDAEQLCGTDFLPYETEALDFRFDGKFLGGSDKTNDTSLSIFEIDVNSCQITPTDYDIAYNDVESLTSEECVQSGFVEGNVDGGGRSVAGGLEGLNVRLEADVNEDGIYSFSTQRTTNAEGYYSFTKLPFGNYRLIIENSATPVQEFSLDGGSDYAEVPMAYGGARYTIMLPVIQR